MGDSDSDERMKSNKFVILLLILILATTTSATSFLSCDPFFYSRVRTLVFDFGLFLFDVLSDILNGVVFMREGQETWGLAMIGITLLPMTVVYALAVLFFLFDISSWWSRLAIILIAPILAPLAIPIMTVAYVVFVAYIFARKCVQPDFTPDDHNNGKSARYFKLVEALFEASFQSVIVPYILLKNGLSRDPFSLFLQLSGVAASVATVARTCTEWHLHTNFLSYDQACVVAFLNVFSIVPLAIFSLTTIILTCLLNKISHREDPKDSSLSLFAPSISDPASKFGWNLLKATMLASTSTLLPSLVFIKILPLLSSDTVPCPLTASHFDNSSTLAMDKSTGRENPANDCVLDAFSDYFFLPLLILGLWCLFEEVAILCKKSRTWPFPYRWAEAPWVNEDDIVAGKNEARKNANDIEEGN